MVLEVTQVVEVYTQEELLEEVTQAEQGVATPAAEEAILVHPHNKATQEVRPLNKVILEQLHPLSRVVTEVPHPSRVATVLLCTVNLRLTPVLRPGSGL